MTSVSTDRRFGINSGAAVKVPCRCATTAAIALNGLQTIDGITVVADDRVLVKNQASSIANGIYAASTGNWARVPDFDGKFDVKKGTTVYVTDGTTQSGQQFALLSSDPILIGSSAITWGPPNSLTALAADLANSAVLSKGDALIGVKRTATGAIATTSHAWLEAQVLNVKSDFGALGDGATDDYTAINTAIAALVSGGTLYFPAGTYIVGTALNPGLNNIRLLGEGPASVLKAKNNAGLAELFWPTGTGTIAENLVFDGNRANAGMSNTTSYVIYMPSSQSRLRNCEVRFGTRVGIAFGGNATTEDFEFSNCWIHDNGGVLNSSGIGVGIERIGSVLPNDVRIRGCLIENNYNTITQPNTSAGINGAGTNLVITDNFLRNNYNVNGGQIAVSGGAPIDDKAIIANNIVAQTATFGGELTCGIEIDANNTVCEGNLIYGATADGIRPEGSSSNLVIADNVISCGLIGINLINSGGTGPAKVRINDNVILAGTTGISSQSTVGGNLFVENNYIDAGIATKIAGVVNFTAISNNANYNPVGASAVTPGASPWTYTAGPSPEMLYIRAGTVGAITRGAQTIFVATNVSVYLPPNGQTVITYTVVPTVIKDIL